MEKYNPIDLHPVLLSWKSVPISESVMSKFGVLTLWLNGLMDTKIITGRGEKKKEEKKRVGRKWAEQASREKNTTILQ